MPFYGDIVTDWLRIGLSPGDSRLVSEHFSGAVHHLARAFEASMPGGAKFHMTRHLAHLRHLMTIVYERGDFTEALDEALHGRENRETWNPELSEMPSPTMFDDALPPDPRYGLGKMHAELDALLKDLRSPKGRCGARAA